jgi:HEPN domain-containing protein
VAGYIPKIHGLRRLLSILAGRLEEAGCASLGMRLRGFTAKRRLELAVLEDAYVIGRYGPGGYTVEILNKALDALNELIELIDGVRDELRRGCTNDKGVH